MTQNLPLAKKRRKKIKKTNIGCGRKHGCKIVYCNRKHLYFFPHVITGRCSSNASLLTDPDSKMKHRNNEVNYMPATNKLLFTKTLMKLFDLIQHMMCVLFVLNKY